MEYYFGIVPPMDIHDKIMKLRDKYNGHQSSGPHITVKASCGLTEDIGWLPPCQKVISEFGDFPIRVGDLKFFGNMDVLYLEVKSHELVELHKRLVTIFNPNQEQIMKCFELERYKPHITVARKSVVSDSIIEMKKELESYVSLVQEFQATHISLFYRADKKEKYKKRADFCLTS